MAKNKTHHSTILTNADLKKPRYKLLYAILFSVMVIMALISAVPVIWIMLSGFKDVKEMYSVPPTFLPKKIELSKLLTAWNSMKFYKYYVNTFIMSGGAVLFSDIICSMAGYSFSKLKPKGSKAIFMICFWIMLLPGTVRTVPLYMTIKDFPVFHFSMMDTYLPMWLFECSNIFRIILFKNFFDTISYSIFEAATVDGAGELRIFLSIILPLSLPIYMVCSLFCFNNQFGQFFWPYLTVSDPKKTVLGVQIFKMKESNYTLDYQMIALLFAIAPELIVYLIFQKQIIGGINLGGVKG